MFAMCRPNPHPEPLPWKGRGDLLRSPLPRRFGERIKVRATVVALILLLVASCASPRERALKAALNDYKRANQASVQFARTHVKQLVAATQMFHAARERWPQTFEELVQFALQSQLSFDPLAFDDVTFAALPDGSVQVRYDVNCSRFDRPPYKVTQSGSVNVKGKRP